MKRLLRLITFLWLLVGVVAADDVYTSAGFHMRTPSGHITNIPYGNATLAVTGDGGTLYAYNETENVVRAINTKRDEIVAVMTTTQSASPGSTSIAHMAINTSNTRLYATAATACPEPSDRQCGNVDLFDITLVEAKSGTRKSDYLGSINVDPRFGQPLALASRGSLLAVGSSFYTAAEGENSFVLLYDVSQADPVLIKTLELPNSSICGVIFSPDNTKLYALFFGAAQNPVVVDIGNFEIIKRFDLGTFVGGFALAKNRLYFTSFLNTYLYAVDTITDTALPTLITGDSDLSGLAYSESSSTLYLGSMNPYYPSILAVSVGDAPGTDTLIKRYEVPAASWAVAVTGKEKR